MFANQFRRIALAHDMIAAPAPPEAMPSLMPPSGQNAAPPVAPRPGPAPEAEPT